MLGPARRLKTEAVQIYDLGGVCSFYSFYSLLGPYIDINSCRQPILGPARRGGAPRRCAGATW